MIYSEISWASEYFGILILYFDIDFTLESIPKDIKRFQSLWKTPMSTLLQEFLHETILNDYTWYYWCYIDVFKLKSTWTLDLEKIPKFGLWIQIVAYNLMLIELHLVYVVFLISMVIYAIILWFMED